MSICLIYHLLLVMIHGISCICLFSLDICKLGEAMGAATYRVEKPGELHRVMDLAVAGNQPTVIEAVIDVEEVPPIGSRFKALNKFYEDRTALVN